MTTKAVVLGGGMVGAVMAEDLLRDGDFAVTLVDRDEARLSQVAARAAERGGALATRAADLSQREEVAAAIAEADLVLGALPSRFGFQALETVLRAGKPYADITFMPEDAWTLDALAKEHGATAVVDCGVAPGMSNMFAGYGASQLDRCERVAIYVGGLPRERRWPFDYKAGFAPGDVIEEYTRPSRVVEGGRVVVKPALCEPELLDFEGVGTLEAFVTDGLRSLVATLDAPFMVEKTMRYPGHRELMAAFRATGLFSQEELEVRGPAGPVKVRPLDVTSALLFPKWTYAEGEEDLTVMRVTVSGERGGQPLTLQWDLSDFYDRETRRTSMSRTTAFPCTIVARLLRDGKLPGPGVFPPEKLGPLPGVLDSVLSGLEARGVRYDHRVIAG